MTSVNRKIEDRLVRSRCWRRWLGAAIAYRTSLVSSWAGITPVAAAAVPGNAPELAGRKEAPALPEDIAKRLEYRADRAGPTVSRAEHEEAFGLVALDSDRLPHVHARFPARSLSELGKTYVPGAPPRPVAFGQHVRKGQVLAVIWSRDLGEKKSDLIDALSQLRVDDDSLARIAKAAAEGLFPTASRKTRERKVEADRIAIRVSLRTLESWRISKEEIDQVRAEAERLAHEKPADHEELVTQWAKLEVVAPLDGTVIERNVALGELVDTTTDLFKIADLSRLGVLAHAYEEDLPTLDGLPASQRAWSVTVGSGGDAATRIGRFDQVGCIIDPNQHTALVMGWVDNPDGKLRVGQFVTTRCRGVRRRRAKSWFPTSATLCEESDTTFKRLRPSRWQSDVRPPQRGRHSPPRRQGIHPQPAGARGNASRAGTAGGGRAGGRVAGRRVGRLPRHFTKPNTPGAPALSRSEASL